MTKKVIIDCDPGIDDAIAITMALFDSRLDVLAITATAGTVDAVQATNNVTAIVQQLDPPRYPRIGKATPIEGAPVIDDSYLNGHDGLGGCNFTVGDRQHQIPSEKVIAELVRMYPNEVTMICMGPMTNLARICVRDPGLLPLINQVVISGGAVAHPGNVTAAAEFNFHFDAQSAREVFASPTTKSLVPLDIMDQVTFGMDLIDRLPDRETRAGSLLHKLIPFMFRAAHQRLGRELIPLYDPTALIAVLEPDHFRWEDMAGDVETKGELTRGMTIFDRRLRPEWSCNLAVARHAEIDFIREQIVRLLHNAGDHSA
jgi:purine nucleosidase